MCINNKTIIITKIQRRFTTSLMLEPDNIIIKLLLL
jgi:hypothetical protein